MGGKTSQFGYLRGIENIVANIEEVRGCLNKFIHLRRFSMKKFQLALLYLVTVILNCSAFTESYRVVTTVDKFDDIKRTFMQSNVLKGSGVIDYTRVELNAMRDLFSNCKVR